MTKETPKPQQRRRARKPDGQFKGNNPETSVNEAWEPVAIESDLPKEIDYSVKQKISKPSGDTAGKYSPKPKVRPTFGSVTSTSH